MANEDIEVHINSFFNFVEDSDDSNSSHSFNEPENNDVYVPLKPIFSFEDNLDQPLENIEPVQNTVNNEDTGSNDVQNLHFIKIKQDGVNNNPDTNISIRNQTKANEDRNGNIITDVQMGVVEKEATNITNIHENAGKQNIDFPEYIDGQSANIKGVKEISKIELATTLPALISTHNKGSKRFNNTKTVKKERRKYYGNCNDTKKLFICNFCGIFFVTKDEWIRHLKIYQTKVSTKISTSTKLKTIVDHELLEKHGNAVSFRKLLYVKLSRANLSVKNHLKSFQLKCSMCRTVFNTLKHFKSHMKKHVQSKRINSQKSNRNYILQDISRLAQYYGEKKFKCNICCKRFYLKQNLNKHLILHRTEKFKCPCCPKSFFHKVNMISHLETHEMNFGCDLCSKRFSKKVLLDRHLTVHRGVKTYKCNICDQQFRHKKYLDIHNSKPHQTFNCPICLIEFTRREYYKHHINTVHEGKPFKCNICSASFDFKYKLKYHLESHTDQKKFKCSYCSKQFALTGSLKAHEKTHTAKKVLCKVCDKDFSTTIQLKRHHLTIHEKRKDFQCTICSKSFAQKKDLQFHMVTHTGERPYQCDICLKSFALKQSVTLHKNVVHLKKKYNCDQCSKQLGSTSALKRHKMQHSETKPYNCSLCSKSYIQKRLLDVHMITHTGEKNYKCLTCSKLFVDKYKLNRHMNVHLKIETNKQS